MMDSVFMQPTPRSTVMEFFPKGTYARDLETVVQSIGLKYMAWWEKEYVLRVIRVLLRSNACFDPQVPNI